MPKRTQLLAILTAADVQVVLNSVTRHPSYRIDGRLHALQTKIPSHPPLEAMLAMLLDTFAVHTDSGAHAPEVPAREAKVPLHE